MDHGKIDYRNILDYVSYLYTGDQEAGVERLCEE